MFAIYSIGRTEQCSSKYDGSSNAKLSDGVCG